MTKLLWYHDPSARPDVLPDAGNTLSSIRKGQGACISKQKRIPDDRQQARIWLLSFESVLLHLYITSSGRARIHTHDSFLYAICVWFIRFLAVASPSPVALS